MKSLALEHFPIIASAPDGVKKLRELILQLALMGKLVPQDPNDERFTLEAVATRQTLSHSSDNEAEISGGSKTYAGLSFVIPNSWCCLTLGEIAALKIGKTPSTKDEKFWAKDGIPWVCISDMNHFGNLKTTARAVTPLAEKMVFKYEPVKKGTLIMSFKLTIGKIAFLEVDAFHNEAIVSILPKQGVSPLYLFRTLPWFSRMGITKDAIKGATLNGESLRSIPVLLPPLAEQHRIVAKVDELMDLCDKLEAQQSDSEAAHSLLVKTLLDTLTRTQDADDFAASWERIKENFHTLFTTEESVDILKQTLLQLAVMGKLVPQDPNDEPARELLMRLATCKQMASSRLSFETNRCNLMDSDFPFDIPASWSWTKLGALVLKSESGWSPSCEGRPRVGLEWGVLKVSAVSWGDFSPEQNKALPAGLNPKQECEVTEGDFLISRANTSELVARSVIVEECPPHLMMSDKIVRLILSDAVNRWYIHLYNSSESARNYYSAIAGGTSSSMKNVSRGQILNLSIPLPPLAEQHRIVAKVDELMALCDGLKANILGSRRLQEQLCLAILQIAVQRKIVDAAESRKQPLLSKA